MSDALEEFINKNCSRAEKWKGIIETMLDPDDGSYDYASDTLEGILEYIEENDNVTDHQIKAIENIRAKPSVKKNNYREY